jgi:hypothetical protein
MRKVAVDYDFLISIILKFVPECFFWEMGGVGYYLIEISVSFSISFCHIQLINFINRISRSECTVKVFH